MPALSYKERFCPLIKNYSKTHTIRAFRKKFLFKAGQTLSHYYGMRTRYCSKLIPDTICTEVKTIFILKDGRVFVGPITTEEVAKEDLSKLQKDGEVPGVYLLNEDDKRVLAYRDGFHNNLAYSTPACWEAMLKWWSQTHDLPFVGQLIKWEKPIAPRIKVSLDMDIDQCEYVFGFFAARYSLLRNEIDKRNMDAIYSQLPEERRKQVDEGMISFFADPQGVANDLIEALKNVKNVFDHE